VIRVLFSHGADHLVKDNEGNTPLHVAVCELWRSTAGYEAIDALLEGHEELLNVANHKETTPFLMYLDQPYTKAVLEHILIYLDRGGDAMKRLPDGRSPLEIFLTRSTAGRSDEPYWVPHSLENKVLRKLLDMGASAWTHLPSGEPLVLHYLRNVFLEDGTDWTLAEDFSKCAGGVDRTDPEGNSVLHTLLYRWKAFLDMGRGLVHLEPPVPVDILLRKLVEDGDDPNQKNRNGTTPLMIAAPLSRNIGDEWWDIMDVLLGFGADPWLEDAAGECALTKALKASRDGDEIVLKLLSEDIVHIPRLKPPEVHDFESKIGKLRANWEHAIVCKDWNTVEHIFGHVIRDLTRDVSDGLYEALLRMVAEEYIYHYGRDRMHLKEDEKDFVRASIAKIMRYCDDRGVSVDKGFFRYLVDLCL
jgi:hypothetical protein